MGIKEKKYLIKIFEKLEKVTTKFTKENGVGLSTKSAKPSNVVMSTQGFSGFSEIPIVFLQKKLKEKYPTNQGQIVFYVQDDFIAYFTESLKLQKNTQAA